MEESFPFKSTYANAVPLGPIMELGVQDAQQTFTAEAAAQAVDYWRAASQSLLGGADTPADAEALRAYAKMATAQARLPDDRGFKAEAEQTYRSALDMGPANPEVVYPYVALLAAQKRFAEAIPVLQTAVRAAPDNPQFGQMLQSVEQAAARN